MLRNFLRSVLISIGTAWLAACGGYYAIIAMEVADAREGFVNFSVALAQELKPEIRRALGTAASGSF